MIALWWPPYILAVSLSRDWIILDHPGFLGKFSIFKKRIKSQVFRSKRPLVKFSGNKILTFWSKTFFDSGGSFWIKKGSFSKTIFSPCRFVKWSRMIQNDPKWSKKPTWPRMIQDGPKWSKLVQNDQKRNYSPKSGILIENNPHRFKLDHFIWNWSTLIRKEQNQSKMVRLFQI